MYADIGSNNWKQRQMYYQQCMNCNEFCEIRLQTRPGYRFSVTFSSRTSKWLVPMAWSVVQKHLIRGRTEVAGKELHNRLQTSRIWFLLASREKQLHFDIYENTLLSLKFFFFFLYKNKTMYLKTSECMEPIAYLTVPFHPTADTQYAPSAGAVACTT